MDDRSLRGTRAQIVKAVEEVMHYDEAGGHITNPEKLTVTATTLKLRKQCAKLRFDGHARKLLPPRPWSAIR